MNWMTALYNTYERCSRDPETLHEHVPLVPFCHTTVQVQLEIRIDGDGSFIGAEVVPKEQQTTIIPCTESSDGRTTNVVPHPLCDKLMYVSGDLSSFLDDKKGRSREAFSRQSKMPLEREVFSVQVSVRFFRARRVRDRVSSERYCSSIVACRPWL